MIFEEDEFESMADEADGVVETEEAPAKLGPKQPDQKIKPLTFADVNNQPICVFNGLIPDSVSFPFQLVILPSRVCHACSYFDLRSELHLRQEQEPHVGY